MRLKHITAVLLMGLLMASCATGKAKTTPPEASMTEPAAEKKFSLPDIAKPSVANTPDVKEQQKSPIADMEAVLVESGGEEDFIILNFENTDIKTIVATFGELLGINYILTPGVSGSVTIQSFSRFPTKNLFQVFQSILEVNGLTAVKDGDFYRIIPIDMARSQPIDVVNGADVQYALDSSFVTQLFPLRNVKATEVSSILTQLMPRGTNLIVYDPSNLLIVTSLPHTLNKFRKIIEAIDVDSIDSGSVRTFVYHVENGDAKKLEEILNTVYLSKAKEKKKLPVPTIPKKPRTAVLGGYDLPGDLGDITVSAYEDINALLIKCSPRSYVSLLQVLKKIDVPPRQVLIEVMIAQVTLTDETSYGIEWAYKLNSGNFFGMNPSRFVDAGSIIGPGEVAFEGDELGKFAAVSSGTVDVDSYINLFTALAQDNDLNVLASPNILAMDNKEAEIKIGNEVPTATSTAQSSEGVTTSSQIQYKTVGTILTVTPHITEKGNVSMKIVVESSDIGSSTKIGSGDYPSFITRRATTNALVKDGHALFIGGLIRNKKSKSRSGIPFLSKIPILGYFFGGRSWSNEKTEMFVMVTPHVINNVQEADILTARFNDRVKVIRENILKIKEKKKPQKPPSKEASGDSEAKDRSLQDKGVKPVIKGNKEATPPEVVDVPEPYIPD
jgi:type II secretory pathway component GspD/PulD (secretin)